MKKVKFKFVRIKNVLDFHFILFLSQWKLTLDYNIKMREGAWKMLSTPLQQICEKDKIPVAITFQMKQGQNCQVILLCKLRQQKSQKNNHSPQSKHSLLICVSILSDLHQQKNPRALCQEVPSEIFLFYKTGKKPGNQKRDVCKRGSSHTCVFS